MSKIFRKRTVLLLLAAYLAFAVVGFVAPYAPFAKGRGAAEVFSPGAVSEGSAPGADRARAVTDPVEALNVRLELIRAAEKSIDIVCHSIQRSECIDAVLGEILAAAERGVQVRILVDGKNSQSAAPALRALDTHKNIACRRYNPVNFLTPWRWNACLHDKFMAVDGLYLLLGGRNLKDEHFAPEGYEGELTSDLDVLVWKAREYSPKRPGALAQISGYMDRLWGFEAVKAMSPSPMKAKKAGRHLEALRSAARSFEEKNPRFYAGSLDGYLREAAPVSGVALIHNPIHTGKKEAAVYKSLNTLMQSAEEQVVVLTPYATANSALLEGFRSVEAALILQTNSPLSASNYPAFSNYFFQRGKFLATGAAIYEYQGRDSQHGKALVVDGRTSAVGSFNFDDRSMHINTEVMLIIDSPPFAGQLGAALAELRFGSLQVGPDNAYLPNENAEAKGAAWTKMLLLRAIYVLLKPFQFLI